MTLPQMGEGLVVVSHRIETGRLDAGDSAARAQPPEEPSLPVGKWLRVNLFSTPFNTILTIVFGLLVMLALRGLLNFVFSEERTWDAVRINLRLLFTLAYPEEQYVRIWVSLGTIAILAGLSIGLSARVGRGVSMKRIAAWLFTTAGFLLLAVLLREPSVLKNPDGTVRLDANGEVLRNSFFDSMGERSEWLIVAALLWLLGAVIWFGLGDQRRRNIFVPAIPLALGLLGLPVLSGWIYPWGHYAFRDEGFVIEPDSTVALSTKLPWTVVWLLLVAGYGLGQLMRDSKAADRSRTLLVIVWLLSPFVLFWVVLRDPALDWDHVWSTDLPMALAFMALGALIVWYLTNPGIGEVGRVMAVGLLAVAAFNWVAALAGWYPMLQKARISFLILALVALLAPNFAGERSQRMRLVVAWLFGMAGLHYLVTMINADSTISTPTGDILGGFGVTIQVAVFTLIFSFPLGLLLALARTSKMPIFRVLSTTYIEIIRGVPLITILIFFTLIFNLFLPAGMSISEVAGASLGFSLFSAAYLAENVRGGLQSIRQGQYEASDAVGLSTVQRTSFIIVPQALRVSIPPLVGQVIATFKETSLLAIIGIFDFLRVANNIIPAQSEYLGVRREGLLFVSFFYWVFAFSMSKYSQRLEQRLGVGER